MGTLKKKIDKKFGHKGLKNNDFRHISEIYRLEQTVFRSINAKK